MQLGGGATLIDQLTGSVGTAGAANRATAPPRGTHSPWGAMAWEASWRDPWDSAG